MSDHWLISLKKEYKINHNFNDDMIQKLGTICYLEIEI